MGISENFLVNTKSFDPIIKALVEREGQPSIISEQLLEEMGYTNPSDLLVLHVLRGLDIIEQDKTPTDLYEKMVDPATTQEAVAEGVINGYGELFEREPNIHKLQPAEIQEALKEYFGDKKTDLILKYIANTFQKLVSFAGSKTIEKARNAYLEEKSIPIESEAGAGTATGEEEQQQEARPDITETMSQDSVKSRSVEEILFGDSPTSGENHNDKEADGQETTEESAEAKPSDKPGNSEEIEKEHAVEDAKNTVETPEAEAEPEAQTEEPEQAEAEDESESDEDESEEATFESEIHEYTPEDEEEEEEREVLEAFNSDKENPSADMTKFDLSNRKVQKAIVRRADLQYRLEYYPEALESVNAILSYFEDAEEAFLKDAVKKAVVRRVDILNKLDQEENLLPALNEVISRFSESSNESYYEHASMAMLQKAEILEQSDYEKEDLLPLYDAIIERLEESPDPNVQDKVTDIFAKRLELLAQSGGRSEFLEALGTSIVRFKDAKRYRKYLEEAMFRKAELLEKMERNEQALDAYNAFLEEFGQAIEI